MNQQTTTESKPTATQAQGAPASVLRPRVEVFENKDGITLWADLPGVTRDSLHVHVEQNTLNIEGTAHLDVPGNLQAVHAEVRSQYYQRLFTLSQELDTHAIKASLQGGVLELHIPRRAEMRPRRIQVHAD